MRTIILLPAFLLAGLWATTSLSAEPLLVYERTHAQVAREDNTFRLVLFNDDTVEIHFPFYSPHAGNYRETITAQQRESLLELAAPLVNIDSRTLLESIQQQRSGGYAVVTDADPVTIEINDPSRGSNRISAPSPEIWARNLPQGHDIETFAEIAGELAQWMRSQVGEEQP